MAYVTKSGSKWAVIWQNRVSFLADTETKALEWVRRYCK